MAFCLKDKIYSKDVNLLKKEGEVMDEIINKVAQSGLVTIDLEDFLPKEPILVFDIKDFLFKGLILKEKEYRAALQETDWKKYIGKNVVITCSADAIVPVWAYMLPVTYLSPLAKMVVNGTEDFLINLLMIRNLASVDPQEYKGKRVIIKGCGDVPVPTEAYAEITRILRPVAKSIMYGEACSNIPVFKDKISSQQI
jgi:Protein of unknown function (DUF2480)